MKVSIIYKKLSHIVTIDVDIIVNKTLPQFIYFSNVTFSEAGADQNIYVILDGGQMSNNKTVEVYDIKTSNHLLELKISQNNQCSNFFFQIKLLKFLQLLVGHLLKDKLLFSSTIK